MTEKEIRQQSNATIAQSIVDFVIWLFTHEQPVEARETADELTWRIIIEQ